MSFVQLLILGFLIFLILQFCIFTGSPEVAGVSPGTPLKARVSIIKFYNYFLLNRLVLCRNWNYFCLRDVHNVYFMTRLCNISLTEYNTENYYYFDQVVKTKLMLLLYINGFYSPHFHFPRYYILYSISI